MAEDKYTLFKNFMHNELEITKDDIKKWTQDAVKQVAENHVNHQMNSDLIIEKIIREAIHKPIYGGFVQDIKRAVSDHLLSQFEIKIKQSKQ